MSLENFTVKSQEAIQKALEFASSKQNQAIEPVHILKGMMLVDENVVPFLLRKLNVDVNVFSNQLDILTDGLLKVTSGEEFSSSNFNCSIIFYLF